MEQIRTDQSALAPLQRASRARWLWPALALLAVAALAALWLWNMRMPGEGSAVVTFARAMAAHHEQAVEMALILRDRSADEALRQLALDIILTQQAQIGQMQGWLAVWGQPLSGPLPAMAGQGKMMGMATQEQVNALRTLPVPEAEVSFLQLMIRHHQGGVAMAQEALHQTRRLEVIRLATAIVEGQQSEIAYMQELLARRGAAPLAPNEPMQVGPGDH